MDWTARGSVSGPQSGGNGGPVILELPLDKIRRPLLRTRANDPHKVKELMDSIQEIDLQVPVSILLLCFLYLTFFCILIVFFFKKLLGL
jgi:sulfiredoxin